MRAVPHEQVVRLRFRLGRTASLPPTAAAAAVVIVVDVVVVLVTTTTILLIIITTTASRIGSWRRFHGLLRLRAQAAHATRSREEKVGPDRAKGVGGRVRQGQPPRVLEEQAVREKVQARHGHVQLGRDRLPQGVEAAAEGHFAVGQEVGRRDGLEDGLDARCAHGREQTVHVLGVSGVG